MKLQGISIYKSCHSTMYPLRLFVSGSYCNSAMCLISNCYKRESETYDCYSLNLGVRLVNCD